MQSDRSELVAQFVASFTRAIGLEMDAMRARLGPFEVALTGGRVLRRDDPAERIDLGYDLGAPSDKLLVGMECSLIVGEIEQLVMVTELDATRVGLRASRRIPTDVGARLVIYPWFLYEKLRQLLATVDARRFFPDTAFELFARLPASFCARPLILDHAALDPSQLRAVELCAGASVAFVWGPPGTGKTNTLSHIVAELHAAGRRVLVASTTNAALDQALERLAQRPEMRALIDAGGAVRIGRTDAPTHGASLAEVVARLGERERRALEEAKRRELAAKRALAAVEGVLGQLSDPGASQQSLFADVARDAHLRVDWRSLGSRLAHRWSRLPHATQVQRIERRRARLARMAVLCRARTERLGIAAGSVAARVVSRAGIVLSTLTNVYFSPLLTEERFDVLVIDEAAMAILPSVFYAACLAKSAAVMVGDPKQLPAIVQSEDPYVRRAMGRNIFEVGALGDERNAFVAMLRTQYRMHRDIGELISTLYYGGELEHAAPAAEVEVLVAGSPFPGAAITLVDMREGSARTDASGSRVNESSARVSVKLAEQAVASAARSVAVITPYVAQARRIRELIDRDARSLIECSTVHRFQGHERDVVILDTVDAAPLRPGVLLTDGRAAENLVNVGLSRARGKAIIVADRAYYARAAPRSPIAMAIEYIAARGLVVDPP